MAERLSDNVDEQVAEEVGTWIQRWTRFGYATRGVIFTLVGLLALRVALGWGGSTQGARGAIRQIGQQPFGQILLVLIGIGLVGYVVWRFIQAYYDPGISTHGAHRLIRRLAFVLSGIFYLLMALSTVQLVFGTQYGWDNHARQEWVAWLLTMPLGYWLVTLIGLVIVGIGVHAIYRGYTAQFMRLYRLEKMTPLQKRWTRRIGQVGLSALGLTLFVIGALLIQGAFQMNPALATGIGGALHLIALQPLGPYLLGGAAFGFVAYGLHCFALGRFRHVRPSS